MCACKVILCHCVGFNPLISTLKLHSNGSLYSSMVIGTLVIDGSAVTFGISRVGPGHCCFRIGPIRFLAGWHKRRPEPAGFVRFSCLGFLCCVLFQLA